MRRVRGIALFQCVMVAVLLLGTWACAGGGEDQAELAKQAEWEAIQEAKAELDASRQALAEMRTRAAEPAAEDAEAADEEGAPAEDLAAKIAEAEQGLVDKADTFNKRLVDFLNADPMIEGEPPTERQLAALRMKSSEDVILAQEWIDKGGDYKRAIEIYNTALMFDPDNEALKNALAKAEADRFMTKERFEQVKTGMTEAEVRSLLGQVNRYNIKDYPDEQVTAWFYPSSEDGSAAGVFFKEDKKSKQLKVYQVKFEAVKPEKPS